MFVRLFIAARLCTARRNNQDAWRRDHRVQWPNVCVPDGGAYVGLFKIRISMFLFVIICCWRRCSCDIVIVYVSSTLRLRCVNVNVCVALRCVLIARSCCCRCCYSNYFCCCRCRRSYCLWQLITWSFLTKPNTKVNIPWRRIARKPTTAGAVLCWPSCCCICFAVI